MAYASVAQAPRWLGFRLSLMFFLDIGAMAAYVPLLSLHLSKTLAFTPGEIALVYAVGPLASMVGPLLVGSIADRVLSAERSLSLINVGRTVALLLAARASSLPEVLLTMALVGVCAASSLTLAYSIAFQQLKRADGIGVTRVWGTVSWILLLWVTSAYMQSFPTLGEQLSHTPQTFQLAALLTALVAMNALTLPHTPPAQTPNPFAFIDALRLLRGPSFRSLIAAAALSSMCLQFHFMLWPLFFTDPKDGLGMTVAAASRASSLAQIPELLLFPVLGPLIARFGMRRVLIAGTLAWPLRFLAYAVGRPSALVVGMQVLHAVTVVCGVAVSQIAVDRIAKAGSRVSSQALLATATSGAGNLLGQIACGVALSAFARADGGYAWPAIFVLPLLLGALALLIVLVGFRPNPP